MKKEKEIPLCFNASVLIEDTLYFTAANSSWLYALHMEGEEVESVIQLPCRTTGWAKFASLVHYSGKIWMIPWDESDIMIYDIEQKTVAQLPVPIPIREGNRGVVFRKVVQQDNILWLLPFYDKLLLKVNMEEVSCEIYGKWAKALAFDDGIPTLFKSMYGDGKELYLFADGCKSNLIFNTETHEIRTWGNGSYHTFGVVSKGNIYLLPGKSFDCLRLFAAAEDNEEEKKEIRRIKLPDEIWEDTVEAYAYWYGEVIDGKIYIIPHTAKAVLIMDILSEEIQVLSINPEGYQTNREYKGFAGYEVIPYEGGTIMTPNSGNKIFIEKEGKIVREYFLKVPDEDISKNGEMQRLINQFIEKKTIKWSKISSDIENITGESKAEYNEIVQPGQVGRLIYRTLLERKI
ncbi:MAG: hypothetical protein HDR00_06780 [Lachnospiraceae bacterium]|nr:hypothetical protein [Lachnospiraceae bacterium]